jgi:transposase-like protein
MGTPSTAPPKAELRRLYEQHGGNICQIASALGRPTPTVSNWYRALRLTGKGRGGTPNTALPDNEIRALYDRHGGSFSQIAKAIGRNASTVANWCRRLGLRGAGKDRYSYESVYPQQIDITLEDGYVVCFSDAHLWFDEKSRAHEALLVAIQRLKPAIVIANGDILDGAKISRHDPSGLDPPPSLADELDVVKRHMAEIARASKGADRYWPLGNHDSRLSRYLANHAPEFEDVDGSRLDHHILGWQFCMSVVVNGDVMIKHAFRGGVHATYANTLHDGRTIVTGHLHAQMVRPVTDARGTRYGVDLGCLADPSWPQFNYTLNNTKNWRSGFAVLEFKDGFLLPPMLASVLDNGRVYLQRNEALL